MASRKTISKEEILNRTLVLLRNRRNVQSLNLREIARDLGCAHTNLYNYFSSYTELLWEAHAVCLEKMLEQIRMSVNKPLAAECKLQAFFGAVVRVYLENTGWFRLVWLEYLGEQQPEENARAVAASRKEMDDIVAQIWQELDGKPPITQKLEETVHFVHCYIIGEISNYLSGRRLIEEEEAFCCSVVRQAVRSTMLQLKEE